MMFCLSEKFACGEMCAGTRNGCKQGLWPERHGA